MLTLVRKLFFACAMTVSVMAVVACSEGSGKGGQHTFNDEASDENTRAAENSTGLKTFDNHNYSTDGDSTRTLSARTALLRGENGSDPALAERAENNKALAASIQQVHIQRMNTNGHPTRKGRHSFRVHILSSLQETQLAPLVFEGQFRQEGDLLHIDETLSAEHGKKFRLSGVFQDLDSQKKVYGRLNLKQYNQNNSFRAESEILTRSYQADSNIRLPNDYVASPGVDAQVESLKNSNGWVTNVVVVLGRAYFTIQLLPANDRSSGIEDSPEPLLTIQGESLQTDGFVTRTAEVERGDESEVEPESVSLFGANDDGWRSMELQLNDGQSGTQDVMIEFREQGDVDPDTLDPEVTLPTPVDISPDLSPAPEDESSSAQEEETSTEEESAPEEQGTTEEDDATAEEDLTAEEDEPTPEEDTPDEDQTEEADDSPGLIGRIWNYWFSPEEEAPTEEEEETPAEEEDSPAEEGETPAEDETAPEEEETPTEEETTPVDLGNDVDAEEEPEANEDDGLPDNGTRRSLRPLERPENLPIPAERPSRNLPDLEISGINFGLSSDAFLSINYNQSALPRVAQGLHDMEAHYGYRDIRENWIPHMRDTRGSLIRNFWRHGHPVRDLISEVFEAYDVLPTLAYVTILESQFLRSGDFEVELTSAGHGTAFGPFQLVKRTANNLGLLTDMSQAKGTRPATWDERNWFVPSLCGAAKHFKLSLDYYGHADTTWAILAYHAGDYGATEEIAQSLNVNAREFWNKLSRYSYTYQEIKALNKLTDHYEKYVDKKLASYFILQSPTAMGFSAPSNVQTDIPDGHKHKFFPPQPIKDERCERAARRWRAYFNQPLP